MNQTITFYPEGNAECILLELSNGKRMLMDYANMYNSDNRYTDLANEFDGIKSFEVVMFTHPHEDHVKGASDFFYFEHADKYKSDSRKKIEELWISAAFLLDVKPCEDARVIRQEARYRLKEGKGKGIKIFAAPNSLCSWLKDNGLSADEKDHPIIHAGTLLDSFKHDLGNEISIFTHAPFSEDADVTDDRNEPSIVLQISLNNLIRNTNLLITGDTPYNILDKIVERSEGNGNADYLKWDLYDIPHHCSHTGLSAQKGDKITEPSENVKQLLGKYGQQNAFLVASCRAFSDINGDDDTQPPHLQAKKAYQKYSKNSDGTHKTLFITSEYHGTKNPKPLRFEIDSNGIHEDIKTYNTIINSPAPRAGC
ncbi:hypothetical protein HDR58_00680 [bacterium]|nr:hypothetical protein [bacterium]